MLRQREIELFQTFISPLKRERYVDLLISSRGRKKVVQALDHFPHLDASRCTKVTMGQQTPEEIEAILRDLQAPPVCYAISANPELDGREILLEHAIREVVGCGFGTFLCCIPGELAYFEGESPGERYICRRAGAGLLK